jgi:hypothetical protein
MQEQSGFIKCLSMWRSLLLAFIISVPLVGAGCDAPVQVPAQPTPTVQQQGGVFEDAGSKQIEPPATAEGAVSDEGAAPAVQKQVTQPAPESIVTPSPAPNGTYTNVYGNKVPSPYAAPSIPTGASARCRDGTYSFSQSRRGTCSHHGGVAEWY